MMLQLDSKFLERLKIYRKMLIVINYVHLSLNLSKLCNNKISHSDHGDWYADDHKECSDTYLTLTIIYDSSDQVLFL